MLVEVCVVYNVCLIWPIQNASTSAYPAIFCVLTTASLHIYSFTGLPKAAVITHLQSLKAAAGFWAFGVTKDDVMYIPLPLYHSAASLIGIGGTIELGRSPKKVTLNLRERGKGRKANGEEEEL